MAAIIEAKRQLRKRILGTGEAYEAYKAFCKTADIRALTGRAFLGELDLYCLVRCRIVSRGRYGRSREMFLDLSDELMDHIYRSILPDFEIQESSRC